MQQIAIIKDSRLSVDDRGLLALRFTSSIEALCALQMIYLEGPRADLPAFVALLREAGDFTNLDGLPIIVEQDGFTMTYVRPAKI